MQLYHFRLVAVEARLREPLQIGEDTVIGYFRTFEVVAPDIGEARQIVEGEVSREHGKVVDWGDSEILNPVVAAEPSLVWMTGRTYFGA